MLTFEDDAHASGSGRLMHGGAGPMLGLQAVSAAMPAAPLTGMPHPAVMDSLHDVSALSGGV